MIGKGLIYSTLILGKDSFTNLSKLSKQLLSITTEMVDSYPKVALHIHLPSAGLDVKEK